MENKTQIKDLTNLEIIKLYQAMDEIRVKYVPGDLVPVEVLMMLTRQELIEELSQLTDYLEDRVGN